MPRIYFEVFKHVTKNGTFTVPKNNLNFSRKVKPVMVGADTMVYVSFMLSYIYLVLIINIYVCIIYKKYNS